MTVRSYKYKTLLIGVLTVMTLAASPMSAVFAHQSDDATESHTTATEDTSTTTAKPGSTSGDTATHVAREASENTSGNHKTGIDASSGKRLAATALRVCERRQTQINAIMDRNTARTKRQIELFTAIADRAKAFYVKKGHALANYDELVAAVDSAKAKAEADLSALPTDFSCDSTDPKGTASSFREGMKQEMTDLKALRTAVKNLIVGIKSVQSKEEQ